MQPHNHPGHLFTASTAAGSQAVPLSQAKPGAWSRLQRSLSPQLIPFALTCSVIVAYRIFVAPLRAPPSPPTNMHHFTKSWMWFFVCGMGLTIIAATTRSVLKNTVGKQGYDSLKATAGKKPRGIKVCKNSGVYLAIAIGSGIFAATSFGTGVYMLFVWLAAPEPSFFPVGLLGSLASSLSWGKLPVVQMLLAGVTWPVFSYLRPHDFLMARLA